MPEIVCQACGQPAGEGASVRLRDVRFSLMIIGKGQMHLLENGKLCEALALCWDCANHLACSVYTKSAANGQEEGCDD